MSISRAFRNARLAHTLNFLDAKTIEESVDTSGNTGDIIYDNNFVYIKTTDGWKRASISSFTGFLPSDISGLQLWLDASDASTLYDATTGGSLVAADGGVARWEDKSGNGRHATQGTAANRPLRKAAQQNGNDTLLFDGTNDTLAFTALTIPSSHTVFSVFQRSTSGILSVPIANDSGGVRYPFLWFNSDNNVYEISSDAGTLTVGSASTASGYFVATTKRTANTSKEFWRDGQSIDEFTSGTQVTTAVSQSWSAIGSRESGGSKAYHNGDICEIIIYDSALSDSDREAVENYLMSKWGIS
jgi:hypothetical protein